MQVSIRPALAEDVPALEELIAVSVEVLQATDYTPEQRAAALGIIFSVDNQLVRDGTYLVAEVDSGIVGCGAWSRRKNLFGGDKVPGKSDEMLDPARDPARIRGFFIHPDWARKGIGTCILHACEAAAAAAGFTRFELVATVTGEALYAAHGYLVTRRFEIPLAGGVSLPVIAMARRSPL